MSNTEHPHPHHVHHLVDHFHHHDLQNDNTLHVIGVVSNFARYHSRLRLFRQWYLEMLATPNVKVYIVECALGDRKFEVTDHDNPNHLQLRSNQEIWHKESMINLAVKHLLPKNWKYVCWADTDITWHDKNWAQESLHQLQHYQVIQPWRDCLDLNHHKTITKHFKSFCYVHRLGIKKQTCPEEPYTYAHSGFAWCCTRKFWENIEGLIDWSLLGSADHNCAWGMINEMSHSVHGKVHPNFKVLAYEWQRKAFHACHGRIGYSNTVITHHFHGPKSKRFYRERWRILLDWDFDPINDITHDEQGLVRLIGKPGLLQACHDYLARRCEDDISE